MVAARLEEIRAEILSQQRDRVELAEEVVKMRGRMSEHLLRNQDLNSFNLKHGAGGIVDIEFMVQFAVLAWAHAHPELIRWSDNVRILEVLGKESLISAEDAQSLTRAYLDYRGAAHQLALQQEAGEVGAGEFPEHRQRVQQCWQQLLQQTDSEG
jgi:glutamate-ammonia-ligase adenylyltransferase